MPEREYAFIVTSSERMTRKEHELRIAQARSIITKRFHLAKARIKDTGDKQGLLHPVTAAEMYESDCYLEVQQRKWLESRQQTLPSGSVQSMSATLMLSRLSMPGPSLSFDPGMALNFVAHFTGTLFMASKDYSPLQHRARAISLLRRQLAAADDVDINSVFFTMAILAGLDDTIGEDQAFEVHRKQLCLLANGKGRFSNSLPSVNTAAIQHRLGINNAQEKPQISRPSLQWYSSPHGFQTLDSDFRLSYNTRRIIIRIHQIKSKLQELDDEEPVFANLQEACPALGIPDGPEGPHIERVLNLALIRHCVNDLPDQRHLMLNYHRVTMELVRALTAMTLPANGVLRDFMLWMYMVALDSWSPGYGRLAKEGFTLLQLVRQQFPEVSQWRASSWKTFASEWSFWTENISLILREYWDIQLVATYLVLTAAAHRPGNWRLDTEIVTLTPRCILSTWAGSSSVLVEAGTMP